MRGGILSHACMHARPSEVDAVEWICAIQIHPLSMHTHCRSHHTHIMWHTLVHRTTVARYASTLLHSPFSHSYLAHPCSILASLYSIRNPHTHAAAHTVPH